MAEPVVGLYIRIPPELNEQLEKYCSENNMTKNAVAKFAIEEFLKQKTASDEAEQI